MKTITLESRDSIKRNIKGNKQQALIEGIPNGSTFYILHQEKKINRFFKRISRQKQSSLSYL